MKKKKKAQPRYWRVEFWNDQWRESFIRLGGPRYADTTLDDILAPAVWKELVRTSSLEQAIRYVQTKRRESLFDDRRFRIVNKRTNEIISITELFNE